MRFEIVNASPIFRTWCINCHGKLYSESQRIWADLDGKPFKAYYCEPCKLKVEGPDGGTHRRQHLTLDERQLIFDYLNFADLPTTISSFTAEQLTVLKKSIKDKLR